MTAGEEAVKVSEGQATSAWALYVGVVNAAAFVYFILQYLHNSYKNGEQRTVEGYTGNIHS